MMLNCVNRRVVTNDKKQKKSVTKITETRAKVFDNSHFLNFSRYSAGSFQVSTTLLSIAECTKLNSLTEFQFLV